MKIPDTNLVNPSQSDVFAAGVCSAASLTKREYMATAILAGLFAGRGGQRIDGGKVDQDAGFAVVAADALLLELAK